MPLRLSRPHAQRHRLEQAGLHELAAIVTAQLDTLSMGGVLVTQPPPAEVALDPEQVEGLIQDALARADRDGVRGAAVTPYLLAALDRASGGDVVDTNVALVRHNARLAARLAVALG